MRARTGPSTKSVTRACNQIKIPSIGLWSFSQRVNAWANFGCQENGGYNCVGDETHSDGVSGFNRKSSERKWPERAKGTNGLQQNLEGQSWSLCVCIKEAMRTHPGLGRHANLAERTPMRTHSELLCVRIGQF
ncbi:hypothetical protein PIB30_037609 [Stylosanthes scabra]|uniref:Uncharacterized protein n=1 Tax=Stylosanthes scabra TaxID=79078 RepID=A0ABU6ZBX3_9FABA|nr:hypothetical protein [Stylosanthes scabra]